MAVVVVFIIWASLATVVAVAVVVVVAIVAVLEALGVEALAWIMSLFGVNDEDVIAVNLSTQKIIQNADQYNMAMTRLSLEHQQQPNTSVISKFSQIAQMAKGQTTSFYNLGSTNYAPGLPTSNMKSSIVPLAVVEPIISTNLGITAIAISASKGSMTKEVWAYSMLQASHSYTPIDNSLLITSIRYVVDIIDYNYTTNAYDISCTSTHDLTTDVTTTTIVTITNIDATTDNKNTIVTEQTVVTSSVDGLVSDTTIELSNVNEVIAIGTEIGSNSSVNSTSIVTSVFRDTQIITIASYVPEIYVMAKYYESSSIPDNYFYWIYRMADATEPTLDSTEGTWQGLNFFPIVAIRQGFVSVDADKTSTKYTESRDMLKTLGLDVDSLLTAVNDNPDVANISSVHVHLSVNLSDSSPEVDGLIYETFAELYEDSGLYTETEKANANGGIDVVGSYNATITEGDFNQALVWKSQSKTIVQGSIGPVGTYSKSTSLNNLIVRKQVTEVDYIEYQINHMATVTFISRAGLWDTVGKELSSGQVEIPLSFFVVDKFGPVEQTKLLPWILKISFYAAEIIHLAWYETAAFGKFLQVVAIIVAIVVTILTWGAASSFGAFLITMAMNIGIGMAASYAMKLLMESNAPDWLKAVGTVIIVVIALYLGTSADSGEFLSASQLTSAVTTASSTTIMGTASGAVTLGAQAVTIYTNEARVDLQAASDVFATAADQRVKSFTAAEDLIGMGGIIDTKVVVDLVNKEIPEAYLKSIDAFYFKAKGSLQYEFSALFDYTTKKDDYISNQLRIGVV